ncbi:MAG: chromosomal replication initiator protein DnaA [Peptoniphilaceae bacterium]|nr:chromosomal replication initiator protein DnaA [Peptoniphilaceae bacterium]MDY3738531.1 chromosomal replication initiator protein DnaA [Peptoniphilaceae bacterium]
MYNLKKIENELKNIMKTYISDDLAYNMRINPLVVIAIKDKTLYIDAQFKFLYDAVTRDYLDLLKMSLDIIIDNENKNSKIVLTYPKKEDYHDIMMIGKTIEKSGQEKFDIQSQNQRPSLNKTYTFENFVKGKSNELAVAACEAVAKSASNEETRGKDYNPLFIYGASGLGKTHLMHAIGHRVYDNNPDTCVLYISSEKFTNEMITSVRNNKNEEFRQKYRSVDLLLVDDIQFIANKTGTQEEFFHTFEDLYNSGKQIIISSDKPPKEINKLEDRLVSRFGRGLIVDIQKPDFETRVAILQKKLQNENANVTDEVIDYIATNVDRNIRELEGALLNVLAQANIRGKKIAELSDAKEALKSIITEKNIEITTELIKKTVAENYDITVSDLEGKSRRKEIVNPRQIAMYISRRLTNDSLVKVADQFNRDHTTIMHSYDKIETQINEDPEFKREIENLIQKIKG